MAGSSGSLPCFSASPLLLLALLSPLAAGLLDAASAQRVDCRKFVFAPSCRGVAAKRTSGARGVLAAVEYDAAEGISPPMALSDDATFLFPDDDPPPEQQQPRRTRPPSRRQDAPPQPTDPGEDDEDGEAEREEEGETAAVQRRGPAAAAVGRRRNQAAERSRRHKADRSQASSDWLPPDAFQSRSRSGQRDLRRRNMDYDY
ncbi:uncharacterized protein LOC124162198 [Ischnura elegans]|uniref:uncharacterized protein LOC124162198 n=1 Tax=Ischnura elegans TaxID=197161 RepID=UPI001ED89324|nr:uncharacterized protein LOC124162198 [Ischnura elegans]